MLAASAACSSTVSACASARGMGYVDLGQLKFDTFLSPG
jgi:hypothetical protein